MHSTLITGICIVALGGVGLLAGKGGSEIFSPDAPQAAKVQPLVPGNIVIRTDGSVDYPMNVLFDVEAHWFGTLVGADGKHICDGDSLRKGEPAFYSKDREPILVKDIQWMIDPDCPMELPEGAVFSFSWAPINDRFATSGANGVVTKAESND